MKKKKIARGRSKDKHSVKLDLELVPNDPKLEEIEYTVRIDRDHLRDVIRDVLPELDRLMEAAGL